jgi:hypothetical protein
VDLDYTQNSSVLDLDSLYADLDLGFEMNVDLDPGFETNADLDPGLKFANFFQCEMFFFSSNKCTFKQFIHT